MRRAALITVFLALGCGEGVTDDTRDHTTDEPVSPSDVSSAPNTGSITTSSDTTASDTTPLEPTMVADAGPPPCKPGPGTSGSPNTIIEVTELINGLPHPVTIPCFLQALDRPLHVVAATSFISAQPAGGRDNPRIFVLRDGISLSFVATGSGKNLLEMGELTSTTRSIKAELPFPVTETLSLDAAFTHIKSDIYPGTVCFGCHHSETEMSDYPVAAAFDSVAYRPLPELEVPIAGVSALASACDVTIDPERCEFYDALFGHGEVLAGRFPDDMPMFQ